MIKGSNVWSVQQTALSAIDQRISVGASVCNSHQFPFNYLATTPMDQFKKAQLAKKASVICCCANIYPSYENLQILTDRNPNVLRNTKL